MASWIQIEGSAEMNNGIFDLLGRLNIAMFPANGCEKRHDLSHTIWKSSSLALLMLRISKNKEKLDLNLIGFLAITDAFRRRGT